MGIFNRMSAASAASFWQQAQPVMTAGEQPLEYAHLRCQSGRENLPGTLFVTDRQIIWRAAGPGLPRGAGIELPWPRVSGVGRLQGQGAGVFGINFEWNGADRSLWFFPQRRGKASVALAEQMLRRLYDEWQQRQG